MVQTFGLTHIALSVADLDRALAFYVAVLGVREYVRNDSTIQVLGPGPHDVIAFEKRPKAAGAAGGIIHFGFRLTRPEDIDLALRAVQEAGGTVSSRVSSRPDCLLPSCATPMVMKLSFGSSNRAYRTCGGLDRGLAAARRLLL